VVKPRKVVIVGGYGFLGWHLRCRLHALTDDDIGVLGSEDMLDPDRAAATLAAADVVFHVAGTNRAAEVGVYEGNLAAAGQMIAALQVRDSKPDVIYAGSIHATSSTPYGRGKADAAARLAAWANDAGAAFAEVRLPNLFGEHGRPHYNSVVATFCHELAQGGSPRVDENAQLALLHAQDAAQHLMDAAGSTGLVSTDGSRRSVTWLRDRLTHFAAVYAKGDIPDLTNRFDRNLFNTYRSYCFPSAYPMHPKLYSDTRGRLFECVRSHGGEGQTFVSSSRPGATRGEHFHLNKVERFLVLSGVGQIALRKLFDDCVLRFEVRGDEPEFVDMPTMWVHSITNTGDGDLQTLFWSSELFEPERSDTFAETVEMNARSA